MKSLAARTVSQLLTQASARIPTTPALGYELLLAAERLLPTVPDPVDYLVLTMRTEQLVRAHCLPDPYAGRSDI